VDDSVSDTAKGRFPKSAHLLRHADFQRVYQQGRRHFSGNMTVFYLRSGDVSSEAEGVAQTAAGGEAGVRPKQPDAGVRVGFSVSKALGGAVERNRMRRRTREAVRHHLHVLREAGSSVDVVINPKKSLLRAEFAEISEEVERAFAVIQRACGRGSHAGRPAGGGAEKARSGAVASKRGAAGPKQASARREARPQ
jgi:ribonuclease P protein component